MQAEIAGCNSRGLPVAHGLSFSGWRQPLNMVCPAHSGTDPVLEKLDQATDVAELTAKTDALIVAGYASTPRKPWSRCELHYRAAAPWKAKSEVMSPRLETMDRVAGIF